MKGKRVEKIREVLAMRADQEGLCKQFQELDVT